MLFNWDEPEIIPLPVVSNEPLAISLPPNICILPLTTPVGNNEIICDELLTTLSPSNSKNLL